MFEGYVEDDVCHSFYLNVENIYAGGYCGYDSGVVDSFGGCYVAEYDPIALYLNSQDMIDCGSALRALVKRAK